MTIDLGYAWADAAPGAGSPSSTCPGTSGSSATCWPGSGRSPAVLLVVAADEGWRAQTEEHLAAVRRAGPRPRRCSSSPAADLADPGPATADALARLAAARHPRRCAVAAASARTGAGLDDLRAALAALADLAPAGDPDAPVRLWVDRSFTITGAGTVVTGTLPTGTVTRGGDGSCSTASRCGCAACRCTASRWRRRPAPPGWPSTCARWPPTTVPRGSALLSPGWPAPTARGRRRAAPRSPTGCRRTPPCTSAPPPARCGCGRWAPTTPGSRLDDGSRRAAARRRRPGRAARPRRARGAGRRHRARRPPAAVDPAWGCRAPGRRARRRGPLRPGRRRPAGACVGRRRRTSGWASAHGIRRLLVALLARLDEHPLEPAPAELLAPVPRPSSPGRSGPGGWCGSAA